MSVQGQFYLSFLLLILGLTALLRRALGRRLRSVFIVVLTILTVASFVYAVIAHQNDQVTAYYNSFARAWSYCSESSSAHWCASSTGRCGCGRSRKPRSGDHRVLQGRSSTGSSSFQGPGRWSPSARRCC